MRLEGFAHLPEIVNDVINGIVAFLLYWPFVWFLFNLDLISPDSSALDIFRKSYGQLAGIGGFWTGIILAIPFFGLLNRAFIYTFIDTILLRLIFGVKFLNAVTASIRWLMIYTLGQEQRYLRKVDKALATIDESVYPSWRLEGTFRFAAYRRWLIENQSYKAYWDWEHFLDWVYKTYYQTFLMFLILYMILLTVWLGFQKPSLFVFFLALPTCALYREYLRHHIAWIRMDQRFFVEYLLAKEDVNAETRENLRRSVQEEDYAGLNEGLRRYLVGS